jgi:sterol desaturase/sphingolipid hydroxylase (fatty acid hydroxylase superfamily)
MKQRRYPAAKLGGFGIAAVAVLLWWAERKRPLRRTVEHRAIHCGRNLSIAALAAVTVQLAENPIVEPIARLVDARRWGLVPRLRGSAWLRTAAALLLLDYTLYVWHVLVHRVPALWRFHAVHHVDRDLDASTALRFHFGELTVSVPWRALQVATIGVSPAQLHLWQRMLLVSILFHHSNLRLSPRVERALAWVVMTPRLHGIHHSDDGVVRDANWSSGLTLWDRLHGTLRHDPPQDAITIGVEGHEHPADVTLRRVLALPFARKTDQI